MTIEIDKKEKKDLEYALCRSIRYVSDRLQAGFASPHPYRRGLEWYKNAEADLNVARNLKKLLDAISTAREGGAE